MIPPSTGPAANRHLNVFDPYRDLPRHHEDQLTRAAMIVLRLVPAARDAFLEAIDECVQAALPPCELDMQATHVVVGADGVGADSVAAEGVDAAGADGTGADGAGGADPDDVDADAAGADGATATVDEVDAVSGGKDLARLVSVFLTPDVEPGALAEAVTPSERGQRLDGVLRFGAELAVVLESKIDDKWARRSEHLVAQLNLHGVRVGASRTCVLPWHDLFETWMRLAESGTLSLAERGLVEDLVVLADDEFAHVLPFGTLRRAGRSYTRRRRRMRGLLHEATAVEPEGPGSLVHVRLDWASGVESLQRAALEIFDGGRGSAASSVVAPSPGDGVPGGWAAVEGAAGSNGAAPSAAGALRRPGAVAAIPGPGPGAMLALRLWPGELKSQAEHLYAEGRGARLAELEGVDGWTVEPQPHLGFRNARPRTRLYTQCDLDVVTYAERWQGEDWAKVGAHHRDTLRTELFPWLIARGYAVESDMAGLDPFLHSLGRRLAHLRPGMRVTRSWTLEEAQRLDDEGQLVVELRDALNRVLGILGEPGVPVPAKRAAARRKAALAAKKKPKRRKAKKPKTVKAKAKPKGGKAAKRSVAASANSAQAPASTPHA